MKIKLIEDWKQAHHLGSVQTSAVLAAIFAFGPELLRAWSALPDDLKNLLPQGWGRVIATAGFVIVLLSRVFQKTDPPIS